MSATEETLLLPTAEHGVVAWRAGSRGGSAVKLPANKVKDPTWIGVPMRSVVSLPMRFPAMPAERQLAAAALELEGAGLFNVLQTDLQIETRDAGQKDQRAWTTVLTGPVPEAEELGLDSRFAPSVVFRKLRPGQATLWVEQQRLTVAIPDEQGQPLHAQALTAYQPDEDAAAELRCILAALDLAGMDPVVHEITAQQDAEHPAPTEELAGLSSVLNLPVRTEPASSPALPHHSWSLVPAPVVQQREQRKKRQQMTLMAAATLLVVLAMLAIVAARLWTRELAIASETAALNAEEPTLEVIRQAQERWQYIESAVNPQRYTVEMFASIAEKLPAEGIRLTNFQLAEGGNITLDAEASNQALAGQLREDLNGLKCFEGMTQQVPPFGLSPDGRATFHADIFLPSAEEGAPTP
jgi:hypothetical protein